MACLFFPPQREINTRIDAKNSRSLNGQHAKLCWSCCWGFFFFFLHIFIYNSFPFLSALARQLSAAPQDALFSTFLLRPMHNSSAANQTRLLSFTSARVSIGLLSINVLGMDARANASKSASGRGAAPMRAAPSLPVNEGPRPGEVRGAPDEGGS